MDKRLHKLAVLNNKVGVGKSTIAVNIAHGIAVKGENARFCTLLTELSFLSGSRFCTGYRQYI